ncbi:ion transporter [Nocardiopsis kunsanensis]|uniref:ion transporter n=1 Tax=Nocardiopsis kunsanensis TaxID=141693 RepID=UPI003083F110
MSTRWFSNILLAVILANAVILGAATYQNEALPYLIIAERIIIAIFVVEMVLKLYAWRWSFFKGGWNWFDLFVVVISVIPATGPFAVLRVLRVLRILRIITAVPQMRQIVSALFKSAPGMGTVIGLMLVTIYTFAILAQQLFGETVPEFFGDLGTTLYTLFMVMTTEDWPDVSDAVLEHHPMGWIFFVVYMVLTAYIVLNLAIGVIVAAMEREVNDDRWKEDQVLEEEQHQSVMDRLTELTQQVEHLSRIVQTRSGDPSGGTHAYGRGPDGSCGPGESPADSDGDSRTEGPGEAARDPHEEEQQKARPTPPPDTGAEQDSPGVNEDEPDEAAEPAPSGSGGRQHGTG